MYEETSNTNANTDSSVNVSSSYRTQLLERDGIIQTLKDKTKAYVQHLREDHGKEVVELKKSLVENENKMKELISTVKELTSLKMFHESQLRILKDSYENEKRITEQKQQQVDQDVQQEKHFVAVTSSMKLDIEHLNNEIDELKNVIIAKNLDALSQANTAKSTISALHIELQKQKQIQEEQVDQYKHNLLLKTQEYDNMIDKAQMNYQEMLAKQENTYTVEKQLLQNQHQTALDKVNDLSFSRENILKQQVNDLETKLKSFNVNLEQSNSKVKSYIEGLVADNDKLTQEKDVLLSQYTTLQEMNRTVKQNKNQDGNIVLEQTKDELRENQLILQERDDLIVSQKRALVLIQNELEDHKSKRLHARNEMILCAQQLEKTQQEVKEFKYLIQQDISMIVSEHIACLESVLTGIEIVNSQLCSSYATTTTAISYSPMAANKKRNEIKKSYLSDCRSQTGSSTADALQQIYLLREQLVRAQTGSMLLTNAVSRLHDNALKTHEESCCNATLLSICRYLGGTRSISQSRKENALNYDRVKMDISGGPDSPQSPQRFGAAREIVDDSLDSI